VSRLSTTTPRSRAESTILTTEPRTFSSRIVSLSTLYREPSHSTFRRNSTVVIYIRRIRTSAGFTCWLMLPYIFSGGSRGGSMFSKNNIVWINWELISNLTATPFVCKFSFDLMLFRRLLERTASKSEDYKLNRRCTAVRLAVRLKISRITCTPIVGG